MNLIDGIENFFDAIKEKCSSDEEYSAEILKARGFLLEDGLILSDNSHKNDGVYLNKLLTEENIGKVQNNRIFIFPNGNVEKIFYKDNRIVGEAFFYTHDWRRFIHHDYAKKIPVRLLEPFIARYIKAISACGVQTWCSCDGNHLTSNEFQKILIDFEGYPYEIWHKIICERLLLRNFHLDWDKNYSKIKFRGDDKWKIYLELNRAAEFLYNNRIKIRKIRREVSDEIKFGRSRTMIKKMSSEELAEIFSKNANKFFDEFFKS